MQETTTCLFSSGKTGKERHLAHAGDNYTSLFLWKDRERETPSPCRRQLHVSFSLSSCHLRVSPFSTSLYVSVFHKMIREHDRRGPPSSLVAVCLVDHLCCATVLCFLRRLSRPQVRHRVCQLQAAFPSCSAAGGASSQGVCVCTYVCVFL